MAFPSLGLALKSCMEDSSATDPQLEMIMQSENPFEAGTSRRKRSLEGAQQEQERPLPKRMTVEKPRATTSSRTSMRLLAPLPTTSRTVKVTPRSRNIIYSSSSIKGMPLPEPKRSKPLRRYFTDKSQPAFMEPTPESFDSGSTTDNLLSFIDRLVENGAGNSSSPKEGVRTKKKEEKKKTIVKAAKKYVADVDDEDVICLDSDDELPDLQEERTKDIQDDEDIVCLDEERPPVLRRMSGVEEPLVRPAANQNSVYRCESPRRLVYL